MEGVQISVLVADVEPFHWSPRAGEERTPLPVVKLHNSVALYRHIALVIAEQELCV